MQLSFYLRCYATFVVYFSDFSFSGCVVLCGYSTGWKYYLVKSWHLHCLCFKSSSILSKMAVIDRRMIEKNWDVRKYWWDLKWSNKKKEEKRIHETNNSRKWRWIVINFKSLNSTLIESNADLNELIDMKRTIWLRLSVFSRLEWNLLQMYFVMCSHWGRHFE